MDDISNIIENLSEDDIGRLKGLANDIFGSDSNESQNKNTPEFGIDPKIMGRIAKIISTLNQVDQNDDRANFISSLKPLLSEKRQQKADEAMKIMHLFDVLPLLKDCGIF
ncbi:MAG: hypothetical protein PUD72_08130 [Oscillospiraceae bacterium]|nr:hypothetical protein [Oscillospiraceae bacterium]